MQTIPDPKSMYEAMGEAIAAWSYVEDRISFTVRTAMGDAHSLALLAAFQSIVSLNGKLDFLDSALKVAVKYRPQGNYPNTARRRAYVYAHLAKWPLLDEWKEILKAIRQKSKLRNHIAHGELTPWPNPEGERVWIIAPNSLSHRRMFGRPGGMPESAMNEMDVREAKEGFFELGNQISAFDERLRVYLEPQTEHPG